MFPNVDWHLLYFHHPPVTRYRSAGDVHILGLEVGSRRRSPCISYECTRRKFQCFDLSHHTVSRLLIPLHLSAGSGWQPICNLGWQPIHNLGWKPIYSFLGRRVGNLFIIWVGNLRGRLAGGKAIQYAQRSVTNLSPSWPSSSCASCLHSVCDTCVLWIFAIRRAKSQEASLIPTLLLIFIRRTARTLTSAFQFHSRHMCTKTEFWFNLATSNPFMLLTCGGCVCYPGRCQLV